MTANEDAVLAAEKLAIHQKLMNRIVARAVAEGKPLTSIQIRQFESDSMSKEEYWKFDESLSRRMSGRIYGPH